jgi:hypothetical protein
MWMGLMRARWQSGPLLSNWGRLNLQRLIPFILVVTRRFGATVTAALLLLHSPTLVLDLFLMTGICCILSEWLFTNWILENCWQRLTSDLLGLHSVHLDLIL